MTDSVRGGGAASFSDRAAPDESIRVLAVDDDPRFAELVEDYLEDLDDDLTVVTEESASAGMERLADEPVDCVVSDYRMPGTDGIEFLRAVREEYPNLPFVLFTGCGSEEVASEAIDAGVTDYLQKDGNRETFELLRERIDCAVSRTRAERRAKIAHDQLHEIFEHLEGFYAVDDDWTVTYWNEQMAERTGTGPEAAVGATLWDVHPGIVDTEVESTLRAVRESRTSDRIELHCESDGSWLEVQAYPAHDGVFVHSRDVTEEKHRIREMRRRNQRLESVARTFSHDLKTPLNVAEGRLDLALETGELTHLEEVATAHNRMQNLINELLRLARDEEFDPEEVALPAVAEEAWSFADTGGADLSVEAPEGTTVEADEGQFQRVFENLFENAVEHGDADEVRVGVDGDDAFYVADDGRGLPDDDEDVFESGVTTVEDGTGYGLSIVDQIVMEHDWEVDATTGPEGGARFEVTGVESLAVSR